MALKYSAGLLVLSAAFLSCSGFGSKSIDGREPSINCTTKDDSHQVKLSGSELTFLDYRLIELPETERVSNRGCRVLAINGPGHLLIDCKEDLAESYSATQNLYIWSAENGARLIEPLSKGSGFNYVNVLAFADDDSLAGSIDGANGEEIPFAYQDQKLSFPFGRDSDVYYRSISGNGRVIFAQRPALNESSARYFLIVDGREESLPSALEKFDIIVGIVNDRGDIAGGVMTFGSRNGESERGFVVPRGGELFVDKGDTYSHFTSLNERGEAMGARGIDVPEPIMFRIGEGFVDSQPLGGEANIGMHVEMVDEAGHFILLSLVNPELSEYRLRDLRSGRDFDIQSALDAAFPGEQIYNALAVSETLVIAGNVQHADGRSGDLFVAQLGPSSRLPK